MAFQQATPQAIDRKSLVGIANRVLAKSGQIRPLTDMKPNRYGLEDRVC
jgi:hypothetical protein